MFISIKVNLKYKSEEFQFIDKYSQHIKTKMLKTVMIKKTLHII